MRTTYYIDDHDMAVIQEDTGETNKKDKAKMIVN